jgi:hypothetical protein
MGAFTQFQFPTGTGPLLLAHLPIADYAGTQPGIAAENTAGYPTLAGSRAAGCAAFYTDFTLYFLFPNRCLSAFLYYFKHFSALIIRLEA